MSAIRKIFFVSLFSAVLFSSFVAPVSSAWVPGQPLVPCGYEVGNFSQHEANPCDFSDILTLVQNLTQFLLYLAVFVATVLFAYAGFLYMFAAGNPGEISKAHRIFFDASLGLVFMASAWLIVRLIVSVLDSSAGKQFLGN